MNVVVPVVCDLPLSQSVLDILRMLRSIRLNQNITLLNNLLYQDDPDFKFSESLETLKEQYSKEHLQIEISHKILELQERIDEDKAIHYDELEFLVSWLSP